MIRHRIVTIGALLFVILATPAAWSADMEGKVQSIDESERTLTLDTARRSGSPTACRSTA